VGHPQCLREPEAANPAGLAEQREAVGREGHEPVEGAGEGPAA
jgi:hypothetical protein